MNLVPRLGSALAGLLLATACLASPANSARGYQIAAEMDRREQNFRNYRMNMQMVLQDRQGQGSTRQLRCAVLEVAGDGDKYLMVFDSPADIRGTAFLNYAHATRPDEQWLYLPSLKRVKRIASDSRSGSFMGSEFAFEDMSSQELRKYTYSHVGDERLDGRLSYKVERIPNYEGSAYTRQLVWVDSERYIPLKIEFYDRRNELLKTLRFDGYQQYLNSFWKAGSMVMDNHQNGKSTRLALSDYRFQVDVAEQDFDPQRLQYVR